MFSAASIAAGVLSPDEKQARSCIFQLYIEQDVGKLNSMKRLGYLVLIALILGVSVYAYLHRQELGLTPSRVANAPQDASTEQMKTPSPSVLVEWQVVDRPNDGFKIDMPNNIKEITVPAYNESGGTDQVQMILSNPTSETSYSVAWEDNPPVARASDRTSDGILDLARDGALARTQSVLLSETRSNPSGLSGRDFVGRNAGGGVMDARMILVGQRLYMLIASFPSASARRDQDVTRFFNSFTITSFSNIPPVQTRR